jgi:ribose 5-phosphate isomerase A
MREDAGVSELAVETRKQIAAEAAAELVEEGMRVGLGTGSTVAPLLPALARRRLRDVRYVATSVRTAQLARNLGLQVEEFDSIQALDQLDVAIDGADQIDPRWWAIKGGGGAHTREKVVAAAAERLVLIGTEEKLVPELRPPVPLELLRFGLAATFRALATAEIRANAPPSPDGGVIADYYGPIEDPARLCAMLAAVPGVVGHGLFPPSMVSDVIIGTDGGARREPAPVG